MLASFLAGLTWHLGQAVASAGLTLVFVTVVIGLAFWHLHRGGKL